MVLVVLLKTMKTPQVVQQQVNQWKRYFVKKVFNWSVLFLFIILTRRFTQKVLFIQHCAGHKSSVIKTLVIRRRVSSISFWSNVTVTCLKDEYSRGLWKRVWKKCSIRLKHIYIYIFIIDILKAYERQRKWHRVRIYFHVAVKAIYRGRKAASCTSVISWWN